jgi:hypothetical protein
MAKNASPSYEQRFFMESSAWEFGQTVSGITDWNASYNIPQQRADILGAGFTQSVYAGPLEGSVSFTRDFVTRGDPVLDLTGEFPVSGSLIYAPQLEEGTEKVFGFSSGYLTSYEVNCAVGGTPTVNCSFTTYGRFGSGIRGGDMDFSGSEPLLPRSITFANQGSITCGLAQSGTNRVTQVAQSYNINRQPVYALLPKDSTTLTGGAGWGPVEVVTNFPVELTTNITVGVDDFETANIMDTIRSGHYESISLNIESATREVESLEAVNSPSVGGSIYLEGKNAAGAVGFLEDNGVRTMYNFNSVTGQLVSENISTAVDGSLSVALEFKDYLQRDL